MKPQAGFLFFLLFFLMLPACSASSNDPEELSQSVNTRSAVAITCNINPIDNLDIRLHSVHLHSGYVIASTEGGLFRASVEDQVWSQLECPPTLPSLGEFAYQAKSTGTTLFITSNGLYSSDDDGQTWHLLSNAYRFKEAFLHDNGSLYAIATVRFKPQDSARTIQELPIQVIEADGEQYFVRDVVLLSRDLGQSWQNITGNIPAGVMLLGIFQDPDHPDLVALVGNSIRNYVFQAPDEYYDWQMFREWDWSENRSLAEEGFFSRSYSTETTGFIFPATLANYFEYDFRSSTSLPAFDIVLNQTAYQFNLANSKIVEATVVFRNENAVPQLIDMRGSPDLWGVRVISPTGERTYLLTKLKQLVYDAQDRDKAIQAHRARPDFQRFTVSNAHSYMRSINLDELYDFSSPGAYKVQLIYDNSFLADRDQGDWAGSFTSEVFTVTIKGP